MIEAISIILEPPYEMPTPDPDDPRLASDSILRFTGDKREDLWTHTLTPEGVDGPRILVQPVRENEGIAVHNSTMFVFSEGQAPAKGARIPMQPGVVYGIGDYDTPGKFTVRQAVTLFEPPVV